MDIAIVGGGWAGLSAALTAVKLGHNVQLFESASMLGGRARSVQAPSLGTEIDNGQHILLGAYTATLDLMRALGLDPEQQFIRLPLSVHSADGALHMRATPGLPAPFHIVGGAVERQRLELAREAGGTAGHVSVAPSWLEGASLGNGARVARPYAPATTLAAAHLGALVYRHT